MDVQRGQLSLKRQAIVIKGVGATVGFTGDVIGEVTMNMSYEMAITIASTMLENMDMDRLTTLDDLGKAAITELVNMITGQSITRLSKLGFQFDLTPPKIIIEKGCVLHHDATYKTLLVPMKFIAGHMELYLNVREQNT